MRHLPFGIAGARHGLWLRVLAPQRGLRCMLKGLCMGLSSAFLLTPTPSRSARARLDRAHDGLPARVHMDVLDRDLLLALAPVPVQGFEKGDVGARELVGLGEAL